MAQEVFAALLGEIRAASAAGGGTALSTTVAVVGFPEGTRYVSITPRNFVTAVVAQLSFCPYLYVMKTTDALVAAANLTDYTSAAQDADAATDVTLSDLSTAANSDYVYIGSKVLFRGVHIDVDGANGNASVLTVKYRKDDDTWADISATDNTASGGATLGVDGTVVWTVPTDWKKTSLLAAGDATSAIGPHVGEGDLYWTRWEVSAALDAAVTLNHILGLAQTTARAEFLAGQNLESVLEMGAGGWSGVEAVVDGGTGNLIVNVATLAHTPFA